VSKEKERVVMKILKISLFLIFLGGNVLKIKSDDLFIPPKQPEMPYVPQMTSKMFQEERDNRDKEELSDIEKIVKKVVKSDDKELEKQAEELVKDKDKFDKLLSTFSKNSSSKEEGLAVSKESEKLLDSFYQDSAFLDKKITLKLKSSDIRQAITLMGKAAGLDFVVDSNVVGVVGSINLDNVPVSSALKIVLSGNKPSLALIKDLGIWRILLLKDSLEILKNRAENLRQEDFVSDFAVMYNAKWADEFKQHVEKMWQGLVGKSINDTGFYLVFDDNTRKIFFRGRKNQIADFKRFLQEIDAKIPQVCIEARVIIASKDFEESFGLQTSGVYNRSASVSRKGWSYVGFGPVKTGGQGDIDPANLMDWSLNLLPPAASQLLNIPFIFGGRDLNSKRLNLVLNAAESKNEINTILKPTLLVNSQEVAELLVGLQVPIATSVQERLEGTLRDINTVNYKDLGMKLKIKPIVTPDGKSVFLDIYVENSYIKDGVNATTFDSKKSIITTTQSHSRVLLKSGQTTLIGGLISNEKHVERSGVPILNKIPILGLLFQGTRRVKNDDQLMIFISPTIV
jgi:type IV pilus assembly protein PilQ